MPGRTIPFCVWRPTAKTGTPHGPGCPLGGLDGRVPGLSALVARHVFSPKTGVGELVDGEGKSWPIPPGGLRLGDLLKDSRRDPVNVLRGTLACGGLAFSPQVVEAVAIGQYYGGYIERGRRELRGQQKLDRAKLRPQGLLASANISFECKQRIKQSMPETLRSTEKNRRDQARNLGLCLFPAVNSPENT